MSNLNPGDLPRHPGVYVLRYQSGFFYVGQSGDIQNRVLQHIQTAASRPYGDIYKVEYGDRLLTPESRNLNGQERDETIERMLEHGIDRVRGWEFTDRQHTIESLQTIKQLIIGNTNCCRTCGFRGHFASNCNTHEDFASTWLCEWERLQTNSDPPHRPSPQRPSPRRPNGGNFVINLVDERLCEMCGVDISDKPPNYTKCERCHYGGGSLIAEGARRRSSGGWQPHSSRRRRSGGLSSESDDVGFDERHCERCYADIRNQPYDHYLCYSCWPG